ncbi:MAG: phosphatidylserine decarboxylase family protein [Planctomycetota bacterium]|jgi:phosphatidylserine decarboxylase
MPLTRHGVPQLILFGTWLAMLAALLWLVSPWLAIVPGLLFLFLLSFFRDPERAVPGGPEVAVAPADGKVVDIGEVEEPNFIGGKALRIGIYLSVFNVHVNRAPLDGSVVYRHYKPGKFLDVRDPSCEKENEANLIGFEGPRGRFAVRQVAGLIARTIVCPVGIGDTVERGSRMGMIKFGSRTELILPVDADVTVEVKVGDTVHGASTVLLRYNSA